MQPSPRFTSQPNEETAEDKHDSVKPEGFKREQQASKGSVTIGGKTIPYDAFAGTVVVHPKGWDDVPQNAEKDEKKRANGSQHVLRRLLQVGRSRCAASGNLSF